MNDLIALLERDSLCLDCLARTVGRRRSDVAAALNDLRRTFRLGGRAARCGACRSVGMTYTLAPDAPWSVSAR